MTDGPHHYSATRPDGSFKTLAELRREHLLAVYRRCDGNKVTTAGVLGVSVKTVYNALNQIETETQRHPDHTQEEVTNVGDQDETATHGVPARSGGIGSAELAVRAGGDASDGPR